MTNDFEHGNRLIVAVDVPDRASADGLIQRLDGAASWVKIGLELFLAEGPEIVRSYSAAVATGPHVMLDLKLHDIPATVGRAAARVASLGARLLTIHSGGGLAMMQAAVAAARDSGSAMRILAVTVLTSMDEQDLGDVGLEGPVDDLVLRRARLAVDAGCDGIVASPHEAAAVRAIAPPGFLIVTPGVRPTGAAAGDQKRVMTPAQARAAGADMVVVGRPIRDAANPAAAARAIAAELASS